MSKIRLISRKQLLEVTLWIEPDETSRLQVIIVPTGMISAS